MYDPKRPVSLFEGDNFITFAQGLNNAYKLRHGLGGDRTRPDVAVCAQSLVEAEMEATLAD